MRKAFLLLVVSAAACSSKPPKAAFSASIGTDAGASDAAAPTMTDGGPMPGDAGVDAAPTAAADAGPTMPNIPGEALDVAIDTAVNALAPKLAPKMSPEGQPLHATLKEGATANLIVTMAPGKCYTFVAFSPPGNVTQIDLKLMTPPFYNVEAAKTDAHDKNPAVIGKGTKAQCPVSPIAVPYRIDAVAAKGAGRVGVYVFSRSK